LGYEVALSKAWDSFKQEVSDARYEVRFLSRTYNIDLDKREVFSASCNVPSKDYISIIVLHYLAKSLKGLLPLQNEWVSFKELPGGEGYYPTFKKRVIDVIKEKYGDSPERLAGLVERFKAKRTEVADVSVALEPLEGVPLLITLWRGDDEFGPEANVLFDKSITDIFETEDIVVLAEIVAHSI